MDIAADFIAAILNAFEYHKQLADRAIEQVPDDKLHRALDPNTNSIAVIMKHVAGNLLSRWTDFLTTDGEKPWRNRDAEFVDSFSSRAEILELWERGWSCLPSALRTLKADDLGKTITIRGEPHSLPLALERSLGHTCYHIGQIVQIARIHAGDKWNTLTDSARRLGTIQQDKLGPGGRNVVVRQTSGGWKCGPEIVKTAGGNDDCLTAPGCRNAAPVAPLLGVRRRTTG